MAMKRAKLWMISFFFYFCPKDCIDCPKITGIQIIVFSNSQNIHFATKFKENSMANIMNSGGSNNLTCIKIDPHTGEKFSLNWI